VNSYTAVRTSPHHASFFEDEGMCYIEQAVLQRNYKTLTRFLDEREPVYQGKGTNEVIRIRSYILASFYETGLPDTALPYLLEELENGRHPYLIAGAALGLRGRSLPYVQALPFLIKAVNNLAHGDDMVSFDGLPSGVPEKKYTTALTEIFITFKWYGAYAKSHVEVLKNMLAYNPFYLGDEIKGHIAEAIAAIETDNRTVESCCDESSLNILAVTRFKKWSTGTQEEIKMEDHDGVVVSFKEYFLNKPVIATFFYTRCDNPNKCSLTITRLAQLQKLLKERGLEDEVKIAAFTYDYAYDVPFRLKNYCENRQMKLNENNRSFRIVSGFGGLQNHLGLGVNYIGAIVNKHKIELYVFDKYGSVSSSHTRLQWNNEIILDEVTELVKQKKNIKSVLSKAMHNALSAFMFAGMVFFPKCPFCWAAYISALGVSGLNAFKLTPFVSGLFIVALTINLWVLWRSRKQRNGILPFGISVTGVMLILLNIVFNFKYGTIAGGLCILAGSILNSLPVKTYHSLTSAFATLIRHAKYRIITG
jgi:protein SCO1/2